MDQATETALAEMDAEFEQEANARGASGFVGASTEWEFSEGFWAAEAEAEGAYDLKAEALHEALHTCDGDPEA